MFICPNCQNTLVRKKDAVGIYWGCDSCGGRAVGFGPLRKTIGDKIVQEIWSLAAKVKGEGTRSCPMCDRKMVPVTVQVSNKGMVLDVCRRCEFIWFDANEYEAIPLAPPPTRALGDIDELALPLDAREKLAMLKVQQIAEQARMEEGPAPDEAWKTVPALLGLPVEIDPFLMIRRPWATWTLSALIAGISCWAFFHLQKTIDTYGLIPAQAWRYHGLTLLTSFFLHGGIIHLAGNLYFLIMFGGPVEDYLGRWRWIMLVLLAALVGDFSHILADPNVTLPCIGASGGISGLLAFYSLKFPHARLGFMFRFYFYFRWIQLPAWTAFLLWILLQAWGVYAQVAGFSHISALAHFGGVAVGVAFWLMWRNIEMKPMPATGLVKVKN